MQYFGVPKCPYCKKRVNIIRVWSLKKHGEFKCPRCEGISNIYLSPLVYVAAILAIACGVLIYFFARFITDTVSPMTCLQVFIPFAVFFFLSLFFVYLEKPVIRRVRRTADGKFLDENGNEMKMKMGKLVSPASNNPSRVSKNVQNTGYIRNDSDMTGRVDPRPAPVSRTKAPVDPDERFFTNSDFADDEELYAMAAEKRNSTKTEGSRRLTSLSNPELEKTVSAEPPVRRAPKRTVAQRTAQKAAIPGTPAPTRAPRSAERTVRQPASRPAPTRRPADPSEPISAGRIAMQRETKAARPNSGFEDIIDTYSTQQIPDVSVPRRPRTSSQTAQRSAPAPRRTEEPETPPKKRSGGSRFRDL